MSEKKRELTCAIIADVHIGDRCTPADFIKCIKEINTLRPEVDLVLNLGDVVCSKYEEFVLFKTTLKHFKKPIFHLLGNHDRAMYHDHVEEVQAALGPLRQTVDLGNVRFFLVPGFEPKENIQWLDAKLKRCPKRLQRVICMHLPPRTDTLAVAKKHSVGLILFAHRHVNRHYVSDGVECIGTSTATMGGIGAAPPGYRLVTLNGKIHCLGTSTATLGGKVASPSGYRLLTIGAAGTIKGTEFRYGEVKNLRRVIVNRVCAGRREIVVNTYDTLDPVVSVSARIGGDDCALERRTTLAWTLTNGANGNGPGHIELTHLSGKRTRSRLAWPVAADSDRTAGSGSWSGIGQHHAARYPDLSRKPEIVWTAYPGGACNLQAMVLEKGALYYAAGDEDLSEASTVARLDARTGEILWQQSVSSKVRGSCGLGLSCVYVHGVMGTLHALDKQTGRKVWTKKYSGPLFGWLYTTPVWHDGVVYAGSNADFRAFDADTGKTIWRFSFGSDWMFTTGAPLVVGKYVVATLGRGGVVCFERAGGKIHWHVGAHTEFGKVCAPPSTDGRNVYFTTDKAVLLKVDLRSGSVKMRVRLYKTSTLAAPVPTADGGLIVADLWGRVYRRDASTGRIVWKKQVGVPVINTSCYSRGRPCILGGPAIAGDSLLVGGADGVLHCFDVGGGHKRWRLELGGPVNSAPAVGADAVYCSTFDGSVCALRPR